MLILGLNERRWNEVKKGLIVSILTITALAVIAFPFRKNADKQEMLSTCMSVSTYKELMEDFLNGILTAGEFETFYLKAFKESDEEMDRSVFEILNEVFEWTDCYWYECLPGQETVFEISEQQLRREVQKALDKLKKLDD